MVARLLIAKALGATKVEVKAEFQVIVNQVLGVYTTRGEYLKKY